MTMRLPEKPPLRPVIDRSRLSKAAEVPDEKGAIATLLSTVAAEHLRLPYGDPERPRLLALATRVLGRHNNEVPCPASAKRMVDEMLELAIEDYRRATLGKE